jgi:DNA-binding transcriptional LysR family regulator
VNRRECRQTLPNSSNELFELFNIHMMNLSKLDLNLFPVFDAIYRDGSLTLAARQLNLSQPAVSHALARLREHLGDPLFVRNGRRMQPTPYASSLAVVVQQALATLQGGLSEQHASFAPALSDKVFNIGLPDILESLTLPGLMAQLREHAPGVSVNSVRIERQHIAESLKQGKVDLVVDIALPVDAQTMHSRLILDKLVVVARADHPAIAHKGIHLHAYLAASHVLVSQRQTGMGLEDFELSRLGLRRQIGLRCRHYFAACRVVSQTDMLLTMPEQYARIANRHFDNRLCNFPVTPPQLDAHLYWHSSVDQDPTNLWLRQQVQTAIRLELAAAQTSA